MDKAGSRMLVTRSSPEQPRQVYLADTSGRRIAWVEENRLDANHPYAPYLAAQRPVSFGSMKAADGSTLHWEMITPPLQPGRKYPVFFEHYGGPGAQQVKRAWIDPTAQYWVSKGWIYFQIDNRGSANRGRAFEDQIYHAMGTVEVEDQATAARWLQQQAYVDPAKIAISGWSYGGYMSLKMIEKAPKGLYAAAIVGAPVTKWELYDTAYTERYLGNPSLDPKPYETSGAIGDAVLCRSPATLPLLTEGAVGELPRSALLARWTSLWSPHAPSAKIGTANNRKFLAFTDRAPVKGSAVNPTAAAPVPRKPTQLIQVSQIARRACRSRSLLGSERRR